MLSKKPEVEAIRKQVDTMRKKVAYLQACLSRYTNFMNSGTSLEAAFR